MEKWRVRRGDKVVVVAGKDRGKSGEILKVLRDRSRLVVAGINLIKKHVKPSYAYPNGGIIEKEATIHVSNVAHVDPKSGQPTKVGYKFLEDGKKVRFSKRSGDTID